MNRVAKRYAKALFGLAEERKILDELEKDLEQMAEVLSGSPDLAAMLQNPLISEQDKFGVLNEVFSRGMQQTTIHFLHLLADKKRLAILPDAIEAFHYMMLQHQNTVEAELISAVQLSENQVNEIRKNMEDLTGKTLRLEKKIDADIIGGFVVRVEDLIIDNSIRNQLEKLRETLATR